MDSGLVSLATAFRLSGHWWWAFLRDSAKVVTQCVTARRTAASEPDPEPHRQSEAQPRREPAFAAMRSNTPDTDHPAHIRPTE
jgi:hypothetical protein